MNYTKEEQEIINKAIDIKRRHSFDEQIKKLPQFLQGGIVPSRQLNENQDYYLVDDDLLTHQVQLNDAVVFIREIKKNESYPFIMVMKPDSESTPPNYDTGIYIPDHLGIAINWGETNEKGHVKVIIDSNEFPVEVIIRDSEHCMTLIDERETAYESSKKTAQEEIKE